MAPKKVRGAPAVPEQDAPRETICSAVATDRAHGSALVVASPGVPGPRTRVAAVLEDAAAVVVDCEEGEAVVADMVEGNAASPVVEVRGLFGVDRCGCGWLEPQ